MSKYGGLSVKMVFKRPCVVDSLEALAMHIHRSVLLEYLLAILSGEKALS